MRSQSLFTTTTALAATIAIAITVAGAHGARAEHGKPIGGPISPLPDMPDVDPNKARLGELLFHDTRLSADDTVSCATCHNLANGGADGLAKPVGIDGAEGSVNTPTVYNSAYNFTQFWDGRAETLEEQAAGPVHNPKEMGSNWDEVTDKLRRDKEMVRLFEQAYPTGITPDNIVDAIATFERTLITIDSPFDRYLQGYDQAISQEAKRGYELFQDYGCISCHQGVNVGGNMYQTMGIMGDYFSDRGKVEDSDLGRYHVTGREEDKHVFKVPSLRMAAHTAPYFHDGQAETLDEAVKLMAKYQLGRDIPEQDVHDIVAFLHSLSGEYQRFNP